MLIFGTLEGEGIFGNLLEEVGLSSSLYSLTSGTYTTDQGGTLTIQSSGEYSYQPNNNFNGTDNFTFQITNDVSGLIQSIQNAQVTVFSDATVSTVAQGSAADDIFEGSEFFNSYEGGEGIDSISYRGANEGVVIDQTRNLATSDGFGGRDVLIDIENFTGSDFADVIVSSHENNVIDGLNGSNKIYALYGDDIVYGGDDNDIIYGDGKGENILDGDDALYGGAGNDTILGDGGDDTISGGEGNDKLYGGSGADTLNFSTEQGGIQANLYNNVVRDGTGGRDTANGFENIIGSSFNDILVGIAGTSVIDSDAGADTLYGNTGDDTLNGGDGDDLLYGDLKNENILDGNDLINGGAGADIIIANAGNDIINGDTGGDRLYGGAGDDILSGGDDDDLLYGDLKNETASDGNDTLFGDVGNDALWGSSGDDLLNGGEGSDVLNGGSGVDTIDYSSETSSVIVDMASKYLAYTSTGNDTLYNVENVIGSDFDDRLIGNSDVNILSGGAGNDSVFGWYGDDVIHGNDGNDTLFGDWKDSSLADGNDVIYGGAGNDIIIGNDGADQLYGGDGVDFIYADSIGTVSNNDLSTDILLGAPVAYWRLDEASGSLAVNSGSGGSALNGTINGAPSLGAMALQFGSTGSMDFDGVNDYIEVADSNLINTRVVTERSIELLFNADTISGRHVLYEEGGQFDALSIYIDQGKIYFQAADKNDYGPYDISMNIVTGQTYAATLVFDGGAGELRGYVDGVLIGTGAVGSSLAAHKNDIGIGAQNDSNVYHDGKDSGQLDYFFDGRISDIALYNSVLSDAEILSHTTTIQAGAVEDVLYGGDGLDQLFGGAGRDMFVFEAASAFNDVDGINNFAISEFDSLDISDLLTNWIAGDPVQGDINNYLQLTELGGHTIIAVDADGLDNGSVYNDIAQLNNVTGISLDMLAAADVIVTDIV